VRQLAEGRAGALELNADDRPITERARLQSAAKSEGIKLHIQRRMTTMVFWLTQEEPEKRAPRGGNRRRKWSRKGGGATAPTYYITPCASWGSSPSPSRSSMGADQLPALERSGLYLRPA
jgi:hypothetical protein